MAVTRLARDVVLDAAPAAAVAGGPIADTAAPSAEPAQHASAYRWRLVDPPLPLPHPSRFDRLYAFLFEYNKY